MEKRQKKDSRNNGNNLYRVEIYRIWDNVSIREQHLEAQMLKYSAQCMAEFPLSPRRCISHTVWISFMEQHQLEWSEPGGHIIIYLILQVTPNKIIVFAALTRYKEYQ